jgi:hypothetical protein
VNCLVTVLVVYLQTIALASQCAQVSLKASGSSLTFLDPLINFMAMFRPDCVMRSDFTASFVWKLITPLLVAAFFFLMYCCSLILKVLQPTLGMDKHIMFSTYGGVFTVFNIGIATQAFSLLQCYAHPNGLFSLRSAADVLCGSTVWTGALAIAIPAILLFVVGYCLVVSWACFRAPSLFHVEQYRKQWKFLFIKFRPSVWWWSIALFGKSLGLSLTLVLFTESAGQLIWVVVLMLIYSLASTHMLPWRSYCVTIEDFVFNGFAVWFASILCNASPPPGLPMVVAASPIAITAGFIAVLVFRNKNAKGCGFDSELQRFIDSFRSMNLDASSQSSMQQLPFLDQFYIKSAHAIFVRELIGTPQSGMLQRLSSKTPSQKGSDIKQHGVASFPSVVDV